MRKHPLLAFAAATLSLGIGAVQSGAQSAPSVLAARGTNTSPTTVRAELESFVTTSRRPRHDALDRGHQSHAKRHRRQILARLISNTAHATAHATAPPRAATEATGVWARLRQCESGSDYGADSGNGYFGAYQFSLATWRSIGYSGLPSQAAPQVQDAAARALQVRQGWGAWPACSYMLGLT